jgi:hypothetical protein
MAVAKTNGVGFMKPLLSAMLITWLWGGALAQSSESDQGRKKQKVEIILAKKKESDKAGEDKRSGSPRPDKKDRSEQ